MSSKMTPSQAAAEVHRYMRDNDYPIEDADRAIEQIQWLARNIPESRVGRWFRELTNYELDEKMQRFARAWRKLLGGGKL